MSIIRSWILNWDPWEKNKFKEKTLIFSVLANSYVFPLLLECFFPEYWVNEFPSFTSRVRFLMKDKNIKRLSYLMWNDGIWWYFIEKLKLFYERNKEWFDRIWVSDLDIDFINAVFHALGSFDNVRDINDFVELVRDRVIENLFRK